MQPFGKNINPKKEDLRGHINQHLYPLTGDPAHKENNSFLHDDMQALLGIIYSALGGNIGLVRIPIGSCCKSFCASGLDNGIPEDTPLMQLITAWSDGTSSQTWFRPPSAAPLGIIPQVKVPKSCDCCGSGVSEPENPDPLAVLGGLERGRETLYCTQIQGNEFGDIQGIISPQTGNTSLPDFPFSTIPAFYQALQNWFTETPSIYGEVSASVDEFGFYTITVKDSNIEITQLFRTNGGQHDWTTIETKTAINASISASGSVGSFVRFAIDSGNDGSRDYESAWIVNDGNILHDASIPLFDGDKVIIEVSNDGVAVDDAVSFIIPDTTSLVFDDTSSYSNVLVDFTAVFDPNYGKEFSIYVLDKEGQKLNQNNPIFISPAMDSYNDLAIDIDSYGISSGVFGLEIQASSVTILELYPMRKFFLTAEPNEVDTGAYGEAYEAAYD